eukprot:PhF_6_TR25855/c0_g1_i1/m.36545
MTLSIISTATNAWAREDKDLTDALYDVGIFEVCITVATQDSTTQTTCVDPTSSQLFGHDACDTRSNMLKTMQALSIISVIIEGILVVIALMKLFSKSMELRQASLLGLTGITALCLLVSWILFLPFHLMNVCGWVLRDNSITLNFSFAFRVTESVLMIGLFIVVAIIM